MGFKKGFTQKRWNRARELKEFYESDTGDTSRSLREFYKTENVALQEVYKYDVTIELDFTSLEKGYSFFIPQETFTFYSTNPDSKDFFEEQVKAGISNIFKGKARGWIHDNLTINDSSVIRGVEQDKLSSKYYEVDTNRLTESNAYLENTPKVSVNKKSKGSSNPNTNNYDLMIFSN